MVEGLVLMLFLSSVLFVFVSFTKKQDEVLKKYELPSKVRYKKYR